MWAKPRFYRKGHAYWEDLIRVLDCEYIRRVWTYQEILLASRPALVCGSSHLPWNGFENSLLFISNSRVLGKYVTTWESIAFDRARLDMTARLPALGNTKLALEEDEIFVRRVLMARRGFKRYTAVLFLGLGLSVVLYSLANLFRLGARRAVGWIWSFGFFVMFVGFGILYATNHGFNASVIRSSRTDNLSKGLYERKSTDPKDMAYGMWAILKARGAPDLSTPSYQREVGDIYKELTVNLIQLTGSLEFLFFAAAQRQPGLPSWVPDWSAHSSHQWTSRSPVANIDKPGNPVIDGVQIERIRDQERREQVLSIDQIEGVLTTRARDQGRINSCFKFTQTSETFADLEKDIHVANLSSLLLCTSASTWKTCFLLDLAEVDEVHTSRHRGGGNRDKVATYLAGSRRRHLQSTLDRWAQGHETPGWFNTDFLPAFIQFCNLLAGSRRMLCHASLTDMPERAYIAACAHRAQVGDRIMRICGLSRPLIVREIPGLRNSVELVSPATIPEYTFWFAGPSNSVMGTSGFFDYHIH